jgi:hypothetical protein
MCSDGADGRDRPQKRPLALALGLSAMGLAMALFAVAKA